MNLSVERVRDALADLIRAALVSDDAKSLGFRRSARTGLAALAQDPPDPESLRLDGAWTLAIAQAESLDLIAEAGQVNLTLPRDCPFTLHEILSHGLDVDLAVERIRKSASTG